MAAQFTFEMRGTRELKAALRKLGPAATRAGAQSLYESAEMVMTRSKEEFCPVHTGLLKSTGQVAPPDIAGTNIKVSMGYGSAACDYAIYVHETNKNYNFGKQWKYLETPLKEAVPDIESKLVDDLNEALRP